MPPSSPTCAMAHSRWIRTPCSGFACATWKSSLTPHANFHPHAKVHPVLPQTHLLTERSPGASQVIPKRQREEDAHPIEPSNHRQLDDAGAVLHVHEIEHH